MIGPGGKTIQRDPGGDRGQDRHRGRRHREGGGGRCDRGRGGDDWIRGIIAEAEVGKIYTGKVVNIKDFGAFVDFLGSRDGLVHISELAPKYVNQTDDVVNR